MYSKFRYYAILILTALQGLILALHCLIVFGPASNSLVFSRSFIPAPTWIPFIAGVNVLIYVYAFLSETDEDLAGYKYYSLCGKVIPAITFLMSVIGLYIVMGLRV